MKKIISKVLKNIVEAGLKRIILSLLFVISILYLYLTIYSSFSYNDVLLDYLFLEYTDILRLLVVITIISIIVILWKIITTSLMIKAIIVSIILSALFIIIPIIKISMDRANFVKESGINDVIVHLSDNKIYQYSIRSNKTSEYYCLKEDRPIYRLSISPVKPNELMYIYNFIDHDKNRHAIFRSYMDSNRKDEKIKEIKNSMDCILHSPDGKWLSVQVTIYEEIIREYLGKKYVDEDMRIELHIIELEDIENANFINLGIMGFQGSSWSPDSKYIAYSSTSFPILIDGRFISRGKFSIVNIYDTQDRIAFDGALPAWSPDGKMLSYMDGDTLFLWDVKKRKVVKEIKLKNSHYGIAFDCIWSKDSKYIFYEASLRLGIDREGIIAISIENPEMQEIILFSKYGYNIINHHKLPLKNLD